MKEFFSETGTLSMTRLTTFILVICVVVVSLAMVYLVYKGKPTGELLALIGIVLPAALASKVLQRKIENDSPVNSTPEETK